MKKIRALTASEVEARIFKIHDYTDKKTKEQKHLVKILIFKKPFVDEHILDESFGYMNYSMEPINNPDPDGCAGCKITITDSEKNLSVTRYGYPKSQNENCEKNPIAVAGFACGIGTELFTVPRIIFFDNEANISVTDNGPKCNDHFVVKALTATEINGYKTITKLAILNETTNVLKQWVSEEGIYNLRKPTVVSSPKKPSANKTETEPPERMQPKEQPKEEIPAQNTAAAPEQKIVSVSQMKYIRSLCRKKGISEESICTQYGVGSLQKLLFAQASEAIKNMSAS